ncbi:hypothetical protein AB3X52_13550 [Nocardioides sp. DS6]|uniref:Uncharacterized protein n=1 Tax=Nocardioides eburneus TaxID=3231482 RepID=A0ABV3T0B9_9ACTN
MLSPDRRCDDRRDHRRDHRGEQTPERGRRGAIARCAAAVVGVLLVAPLTASCGGSSTDAYCDAVKGHQKELTDLFSAPGDGAVLKALPALRDLRDAAPSDIRADWNQLVGALGDLQSALDAADVAPGDYAAGKPPAGLTAAERARITAAANEVSGAQEASAHVLQEVRDVCHTPLTL